MENASQALFMAAGVLIAIMVISIGVYLFSSASRIAESYETTMSATEIQKFNNQFEKYSKQPKYVKKISENNFEYKSSVDSEDKEYVFCDYNTISDVVSAINLAYNINANNNYDQGSGIQISIEKLTSVDGKCFRSTMGINPSMQKLHKNANPRIIDNNCIYDLGSIDVNTKIIYSTPSKEEERVNMNLLLTKCNESILRKNNENNERIYKYGFEGETIINSQTGLIDIIKFKLVKNATY